QNTEPRPDLHRDPAGREPRHIDDPCHDPTIGQEILPLALTRPHLQLAQQRSPPRRNHRRPGLSPSPLIFFNFQFSFSISYSALSPSPRLARKDTRGGARGSAARDSRIVYTLLCRDS